MMVSFSAMRDSNFAASINGLRPTGDQADNVFLQDEFMYATKGSSSSPNNGDHALQQLYSFPSSFHPRLGGSEDIFAADACITGRYRTLWFGDFSLLALIRPKQQQGSRARSRLIRAFWPFAILIAFQLSARGQASYQGQIVSSVGII